MWQVEALPILTIKKMACGAKNSFKSCYFCLFLFNAFNCLFCLLLCKIIFDIFLKLMAFFYTFSYRIYTKKIVITTCLPSAWVPVFPTDVLRHFMYSLPNPSESERPFSPLEEQVLRARGTELNGFLCFAPGTALHLPRRIQDPKGPISLVLGSWRLGGGYSGGRDGDWQWKGGGWHIFYRWPVLTSITLAFFKSMCSAHSSCGIKSPTISKFWSYMKMKKKHIKDFFCL
jgi:hypothetical protein